MKRRSKLLLGLVPCAALFICFILSFDVFGGFGVIAPSFAANEESKPFIFTAIPDQNQRHLQQRFSKVARYLSDTLQVDVKYIPVKSYAAAVTAFRNNEVQLGWFGGLSGIQARRLLPGSQAIAQGYEDPLFKTYFIAHTSTGLKPSSAFPSDIKGKTLIFGSKGSTSGRLMPEYFIRDHYQQDPNALFPRIGYSGDHHKTIELVQSGVYEVGVVNYKVWEKQLADGKINADNVNVIWESPPYADYHWTIRGDVNDQFGQGFQQKVQQALIDMSDPDLLASFPRQRFVTAKNSDYDALIRIAQIIGIIDPVPSVNK